MRGKKEIAPSKPTIALKKGSTSACATCGKNSILCGSTGWHPVTKDSCAWRLQCFWILTDICLLFIALNRTADQLWVIDAGLSLHYKNMCKQCNGLELCKQKEPYDDSCDADESRPRDELQGVERDASKSGEVENLLHMEESPMRQAALYHFLHKIHEGLPAGIIANSSTLLLSCQAFTLALSITIVCFPSELWMAESALYLRFLSWGVLTWRPGILQSGAQTRRHWQQIQALQAAKVDRLAQDNMLAFLQPSLRT